MEKIKTGTTTMGITCKDAEVQSRDRRATAGTMIAHKNVEKISKISDHIGMTVRRFHPAPRYREKWMKAEFALYNVRNGKEISVPGAATMLSNILNQYKFSPYYVELLVGGYDSNGPHIIDLDAAGGLFEDRFISTGSGSPFAYGLLESNYKENMSLEKTLKLAKECVRVAMSRDSASGDYTDLVYINSEGFKRLSEQEVENI